MDNGKSPFLGVGRDGLTLRDYFAGQALSGVCGSRNSLDRIMQLKHDDETPEHAVSRACYEMADAMLAERARAEGQ